METAGAQSRAGRYPELVDEAGDCDVHIGIGYCYVNVQKLLLAVVLHVIGCGERVGVLYLRQQCG